jgi:arsenite methyltransferase
MNCCGKNESCSTSKSKNEEKTIDQDLKLSVKEHYGKLASETTESKDFGNPISCCGASSKPLKSYTKQLGYSNEEIESIPDEVNLGLGCGNPISEANIIEGEIVLDLGSGPGFDCFIASKKVGPTGKVIGIDMTQSMIDKANNTAKKNNIKNVEFRLGEIESLPVESDFVDVIISNCVVNLSTKKENVYRESYRVLKPGGRFVISDIVATSELPENIKKDVELYNGCMAGASTLSELEKFLKEAGFDSIKIDVNEESRQFIEKWESTGTVKNYVASALIQAKKPLKN